MANLMVYVWNLQFDLVHLMANLMRFKPDLILDYSTNKAVYGVQTFNINSVHLKTIYNNLLHLKYVCLEVYMVY